MIDSVLSFLQALRRSRLLNPAQLNELKAKVFPAARDANELAELLVQRNVLTPFQVEALFEGREDELVVGPYQLQALVGEGGICQVFKARHNDTDEIVALKILRPELRGRPESLVELKKEMQVLAGLDHPRFVKALDVDLDSDRFWFAMELVEGIDLKKLLELTGPLPIGQASDYIRQAAQGLQYAFEKGLVHRDIKPANLLVAFDDERVRILDIGLARLEWYNRDDTPTATPTRRGTLLLGTPDYVAPEQALNPEQANIRADIYSLGCTFYHLLTGQPPFPGKSLTQKLLHHQQTPPPSARDLRPEVPQELAELIQRLMAKSPDDRFPTPAGVAVALVRFCNDAGRIAIRQFRPQASTESAARIEHQAPPAVTAPSGSLPAATRPAPVAPNAVNPAPRYGPGGLPERRAYPRRKGNPVPVLILQQMPGDAEPLCGWVIDRSYGGVGLLVDEPLEIDLPVEIRPQTPQAGSRGSQVRVVYCIPERASWRVGCQFLHKPSWDELRIYG